MINFAENASNLEGEQGLRKTGAGKRALRLSTTLVSGVALAILLEGCGGGSGDSSSTSSSRTGTYDGYTAIRLDANIGGQPFDRLTIDGTTYIATSGRVVYRLGIVSVEEPGARLVVDGVTTTSTTREAISLFSTAHVSTAHGFLVSSDSTDATAGSEAAPFESTAAQEGFLQEGGGGWVSFADSTESIVLDLGDARVSAGAGAFAVGDAYFGIDHVIGSPQEDTLTGNANDNILEGGASADTLEGGAGSDTASYENSDAGVVVDLSSADENGVVTGSGGHAEGDKLSGIENLRGSAHTDRLTGDAQANVLEGLGGDDVLEGAGGNDTLLGGAGNDTYRFRPSDGHDSVSDLQGSNVLLFLSEEGRSYSKDSFSFQTQSDALVVTTDQGNVVTIADYASAEGYTIQYENGSGEIQSIEIPTALSA